MLQALSLNFEKVQQIYNIFLQKSGIPGNLLSKETLNLLNPHQEIRQVGYDLKQ
jgi:hypothetical protein